MQDDTSLVMSYGIMELYSCQERLHVSLTLTLVNGISAAHLTDNKDSHNHILRENTEKCLLC